MSLQGTYESYVELMLDDEPVTYIVAVSFDYYPGEYSIDPQCQIGVELNIESMKLRLSDNGLSAEVDTEYQDGIIAKLNPEFQNYLDTAWQEHREDDARDRAVRDRDEVRQFLAVGF